MWLSLDSIFLYLFIHLLFLFAAEASNILCTVEKYVFW